MGRASKRERVKAPSGKRTERQPRQRVAIRRRILITIISIIILPIVVLLVGAAIVNYFEATLSIKYEGRDPAGEFVFSVTNSGKIDITIERAEIDVFNESYLTRPFQEEDIFSAPQINGVIVKIPFAPFLKERGDIKTMQGMRIAPFETKEVNVPNISKRNMSPQIVEFFIQCYWRPHNSVLAAFHRFVLSLGLSKDWANAIFRLENDRINDIARPYSDAQWIDVNRLKMETELSIKKHKK